MRSCITGKLRSEFPPSASILSQSPSNMDCSSIGHHVIICDEELCKSAARSRHASCVDSNITLITTICRSDGSFSRQIVEHHLSLDRSVLARGRFNLAETYTTRHGQALVVTWSDDPRYLMKMHHLLEDDTSRSLPRSLLPREGRQVLARRLSSSSRHSFQQRSSLDLVHSLYPHSLSALRWS